MMLLLHRVLYINNLWYRYLGSHPNIVSLEDLFISEHYDELYIVMELLDSDLHRIIQSPQALGDAHHRYFMFQLLKGVQVSPRLCYCCGRGGGGDVVVLS